jgi:chemotaxis-related protein WspD
VNVTLPVVDACWNRIGVRGDRSCPELVKFTHCNNCPVFAAAGRRFLDTAATPDYLDEWTTRLAVHEAEESRDVVSVLVFRLGDEWLALPVAVLVEVTHPRAAHRIPHRAGLLSGMVNIRGELQLCVRLDLLLGVTVPTPKGSSQNQRLVVIRRESDAWAFAADEVDQVHRFPLPDLMQPPPTLSRALSRLTRGVFESGGRAVGLLDESRLFPAIRERVK